MSSSTIMNSWRAASSSTRAAFAALMHEPVGLCATELRMNSLGFSRASRLSQRRDVGTVRGARHADDARAEGGEAREHHEPRRILDEHHVARREEAPRHEVDGLGGAGGGDDLVGRRVDAEVREPRGQRFAQR